MGWCHVGIVKYLSSISPSEYSTIMRRLLHLDPLPTYLDPEVCNPSRTVKISKLTVS